MPSFRLKRLVLVPEGLGIFGELTVAENLAMGALARDAAAEVRRDLCDGTRNDYAGQDAYGTADRFAPPSRRSRQNRRSMP